MRFKPSGNPPLQPGAAHFTTRGKNTSIDEMACYKSDQPTVVFGFVPLMTLGVVVVLVVRIPSSSFNSAARVKVQFPLAFAVALPRYSRA